MNKDIYEGCIPETSEIIKMIRKEKKITQKELAKKLNVSQGTISQYENGQISLNMRQLKEVLEALGESLDSYFSLCYTVALSRKSPFSQFEKEDLRDYFVKSKTIFELSLQNNNLSELDKVILDKAKSLNDLGKQKTIDYIDDLVQIDKYQNDKYKK